MGEAAHMLYRMGHARHTIFVTEVSNIDVEGSASLVGFRVVDQQHLKVVLETDHTIVAVVQRRLLQAVCQDDNGGLATRRRPERLRGWHCADMTVARPRGRRRVIRWAPREWQMDSRRRLRRAWA